jgi:hypothetical protein
MTLQDKVCFITLVGIGSVALIFLYVISQVGRSAEAVRNQRRAESLSA